MEICQEYPLDIITVTPRGTLGLCYVHIAQLMAHPAIYTTAFTLQLCYRPLGILQRVTNSQKVHISNHDGLKNLHTINLFWHRSQDFPEREQSIRNFSLPQSRFLRTIDLFFFKQFYMNYCWSISLWLPPIHHINICEETWFPMIEVMDEPNQPQNWLNNIILHFLIHKSGYTEYGEDRLKWTGFVTWVTNH